MPHIPSKDILEIQNLLPQIYAQQIVDGFAATVMQLIPGLIDSDTTAYTELNPACNRSVGAFDSPESEIIFLENKPTFELYMHQHPLVQHFQKDDDGQPKKISDFMTLKQWRNTELYQEFYRLFGFTRQMVVTLPADRPAVIGVALNREQLDFSERDRNKLNLLSPHLAQAYRNALNYTSQFAQLSLFGQAMDTLNVGVIEVDKQLKINRISDLALNSLNLFFPGEDNSREYLPAELKLWLAKQIDGRNGEDALANSSQPCIVRRDHGRLTLRLASSGQPGGLLVTTEQYIPEKSPKLLQSIFCLTEREAEVLFWVAQGKSNPEIAIVLSISPRTVQKHLESIFAKLEVETRVQAAIKAVKTLIQ